MLATVSLSELKRVASTVSSGAEAKAEKAIFSHMLLTAESDGITFFCSNGLQNISGVARADVQSPGSVAVSAEKLVKFAKMMREGPISLASTPANWLVMSGSGRKYTIPGMQDEFPESIYFPDDALPITIDAPKLKASIERVIDAANTDVTQKTCCVRIESDGSIVHFVSTDGARMFVSTYTVELPVFTASLPLDAAKKVLGMLDDKTSQGECSFTVAKNQLRIERGDFEFTTKLLDPTAYHPWRKLYESIDVRREGKRCDTVIHASGLLSSLRAAKELHDSTQLSCDGSSLQIHTIHPEGNGEYDDTLDVECEPFQAVGFSITYLLQAIEAPKIERIAAVFSTLPTDHVVFTAHDFCAIVMPRKA